MSETIGIAMVTYNRAAFASKTIKAVRKNLSGVVDHVVVVNDGSDSKYAGEYKRVALAAHSIDGGCYIGLEQNAGVATAKNVGIQYLLERGCDWIFTLEDDILIQSPLAVTEYIRVAKTGIKGLSFAHHGPANLGGAVATDDDVAYYFHSIGAWCLFHRDELLNDGMLDENLHNAWEHVEQALRIGVEPYRYPDVIGSANWLTELPNSIEKSSIRVRDDWWSSISDGLRYWADNKPYTFKSLFGEGLPLHNYAQGILNNN